VTTVKPGTSYAVTSRRLDLRPLQAADIPALHELWTNVDVRRYLWDGESIPLEKTTAIVAESERLFAREGVGLWGAWTRESNTLCGFGGFWYFREPPVLELLYGVHRAHWGQGFATEIGGAVIGYGTTALKMREVRATTDVPNRASVRVLEHLGFALERRATVNGLDTLFYRKSNSKLTSQD
jgi:ribosomal-protein-alanine N-acetyltransferase